MTQLNDFRQLEVKASLEHAGRLWFGTANGLYCLPAESDQPASLIGDWQGEEVQALAGDGHSMLLACFGPAGPRLVICDADGRAVSWLTPPAGEKIKAMAMTGQTIWLGTKRGVFKRDGDGWRHVFDGNGKAEIIGLWLYDDLLVGSVKKMAPDDLPALIESRDGGESWSVEIQPDYQDVVVAADGDTIITRWRGARPRGARAGYKKHPITAGQIPGGGRWAVVDGDKMEVGGGSAAQLSTYHPAFGEAERLHLVPGGVVVAGAQGAWRFEPATGRFCSLLPDHAITGLEGKIKRVFRLDDVLLAATTFGTFRSFDDGRSWERSDVEWWVLDAERAARDATGRWWILCQRGLFRTDDLGGRIDYHKIKVKGDHYSELRTLAVAGERVCLGTKQGLFVNRPGSDTEAFFRVEAFGKQPIEALAWDAQAGRLLVGTATGGLWSWDLATPPDRIADQPLNEATILVDKGIAWIANGYRLTEMQGMRLRDITPPVGEGAGSIHLEDAGDRLLAWNRQAAWLRSKAGGAWVECAGWPMGLRHVALDAARGLCIGTDRARLHHIAL